MQNFSYMLLLIIQHGGVGEILALSNIQSEVVLESVPTGNIISIL